VEFNVLVFGKVLRSFQERFLSNEKRGYAQSFTAMDPGADPGDFIAGFFNSEGWRRGESPHGNVHASARGLAKLAAAMANGGQLGGVRLLTANGWALLHHGGIVREDASMRGCRTEFTQVTSFCRLFEFLKKRLIINFCTHFGRETYHLRFWSLKPVFRIHDILVWIRISGSMPLTNGSGSGTLPV
jgi:hypothetical protein